MRQTGMVARCLLLASSLVLSGRAFADCEGGPIFPEAVIAADKNTFVWATPMDVDYTKGDVASLPTYTSWVRGSLTQATALDISQDNLAPGQCAFYILKPTGPPCGSWQSSPGAEPDRDIAIQAPCSQVAPTDEQLQAAVDGALQVAPNPWGNQDDAGLFHQFVQDALGCTFEVFDQTATTSSALDGSPTPGEFYCGLDFSFFALELTSGPCMNQACFAHDSCYFQHCAGGICAFSPQTDTTGCDAPLVITACDPSEPPPLGCLQSDGAAPGIKGIVWRAENKLICMVAEAMTVAQSINPVCQDPLCNNAGEQCDPSTSKCSQDLDAWISEDYIGITGDPASHWTVAANHLTVTQSTNSRPTVFYSGADAGIVEARVKVTGSEDDFIGFVLGFNPGDAANPNAEYYLVDWKKANQSFNFGHGSVLAKRGLAVSRVFGKPYGDEFWAHVNRNHSSSDLNSGLEELQRGSTLGDAAWVKNREYLLTFYYLPTSITVWVDGKVELSIPSAFHDGRFGFYNFSQPGVQYGPAVFH